MVLKGEYKAKQEKYDDAIESLQQAVIAEDALNYDEPPDWFFSVRHHLGAVQIEAGLYADAVKTYEQDLKVSPENVWALAGLHTALLKLGKTTEAVAVKKRIDVASQYADVKIENSRMW
jgi:tetratricopeptide (TPR) repeat protein